jgi:hypothetical protein
VKRVRKVVKRAVDKVKEKAAEPAYASCWACSLGKCGYAPPDNTCQCCRADHTGVR